MDLATLNEFESWLNLIAPPLFQDATRSRSRRPSTVLGQRRLSAISMFGLHGVRSYAPILGRTQMQSLRAGMTMVEPPFKLTEEQKGIITENIRDFIRRFEGAIFGKVGSTQNLTKRMRAKDYKSEPFARREFVSVITGLCNDVVVAEAERFASEKLKQLLNERGDNSISLNKRLEWGKPDGTNSLGRGGKYRPCFTGNGCIYCIVAPQFK